MLTDNNSQDNNHHADSKWITEFYDRIGIDQLIKICIKDSEKIAQMQQLLAENTGAETVLREYLKNRIVARLPASPDMHSKNNFSSFKSSAPEEEKDLGLLISKKGPVKLADEFPFDEIPIDYLNDDLDYLLQREKLEPEMVVYIKELVEKCNGAEIVLRQFLEYSQTEPEKSNERSFYLQELHPPNFERLTHNIAPPPHILNEFPTSIKDKKNKRTFDME